jgi:hypothetical protein
MMMKLFLLLVNFIINTIKLNYAYIGIMRTSIINPSGKFYDFVNNEYFNDNNDDEYTGYSRVNLTDCKYKFENIKIIK